MVYSRCDDNTTQNAQLASYTRNIKNKNYEQESHAHRLSVDIATTVIMVTSLTVIDYHNNTQLMGRYLQLPNNVLYTNHAAFVYKQETVQRELHKVMEYCHEQFNLISPLATYRDYVVSNSSYR